MQSYAGTRCLYDACGNPTHTVPLVPSYFESSSVGFHEQDVKRSINSVTLFIFLTGLVFLVKEPDSFKIASA